jgi:hypothetical protein
MLHDHARPDMIEFTVNLDFFHGRSNWQTSELRPLSSIVN